MIIEVTKLNSFKDKSIGLLKHSKPVPVFFKTRFGIHTIGMKFPIDILILDKKRRVVKLKENLKPNNIFSWLPIYDLVIELPDGYIKKSNIKIGDNVEIMEV